ncbi:MAG: hypothetical protein V7L23_11515 [Nostoc sp.]
MVIGHWSLVIGHWSLVIGQEGRTFCLSLCLFSMPNAQCPIPNT